MDAQQHVPLRLLLEFKAAAQPDVVALPFGADDGARRALRAEAAVALGPRGRVEVGLLPAVARLRGRRAPLLRRRLRCGDKLLENRRRAEQGLVPLRRL